MSHNLAITLILFGLLAGEKERDQELSERWFEAIRNDQEAVAIIAARDLITDKELPLIPDYYPLIFKNYGINVEMLQEREFNDHDYQLWRDAWFFHQKASALKTVSAIFAACVSQIDPNKEDLNDIPWPRRVWDRGFGACDRSAWVFCEILYQLGAETQVVYLWDNEHNTSPHTIAEVHLEAVTYTADVYMGKIFPLSLGVLFQEKESLKKAWVNKPDFVSIDDLRYWTPSYAQDYCPKNQLLQRLLRQHLGSQCPRFGEDPQQRMLRYRSLTNTNHQMALWFYPIALRSLQIEKQ